MSQYESFADIDAPIATVFSVVADFQGMSAWQPDITRVECHERDDHGRALLVTTELQTIIRPTTSLLRVTYDEPTCVSWELVKGDVKRFEGCWALSAGPAGTTRATYAVTIDFGRTLGMLVRGPAAAKLGHAAVSSMPMKLKSHVETAVREDGLAELVH